ITSMTPPFLIAIALTVAGRALIRPRRRAPKLASRALLPVVVVSVFLIPCSYRTVQASTPDVIYFHAIGGLIKHMTRVRTPAQIRPGLRTPPARPPVAPAPGKPKRNVIFVLTESVRYDASCAEHAESCPTAPETNAAAPARMGLRQMRSNSSTTAIQLAVLWSGLQPTASREALHTAPLLFDYA